MKGKFIKSIIALSLCICTAVTCLAADITLKIDGSEISSDAAPQIIDGRTMVPLRAIFENIGASVDWDSDTKTITADKDSTTVVMTVGSTTEYINGSAVTMDVAPQIIDGRTLIPAKYAAEAFGYSVSWNSETKTVDIVSGGTSNSISGGENSLGIDPAAFIEIKTFFYDYVDKISNTSTSAEANALTPKITENGVGFPYTVSIQEYQALIDASDNNVEQFFVLQAATALELIAFYRYIDLSTKELTGSIPSQSNYDAFVNYSKKIFEAGSIDEAMEITSDMVDSVSNYVDLIAEEVLKA